MCHALDCIFVTIVPKNNVEKSHDFRQLSGKMAFKFSFNISSLAYRLTCEFVWFLYKLMGKRSYVSHPIPFLILKLRRNRTSHLFSFLSPYPIPSTFFFFFFF